MFLAALVLLFALGCGSAPTPAKMPELPDKVAPSRIADAIQGVWALEEIDGRKVEGWATFTDGKYEVFIRCGSANGYFEVMDDMVTADIRSVIGIDSCRQTDIDGPSFMTSRFRVQVDDHWLIVSSLQPRGDRWARYRRSSVEEARAEMWKRYKSRKDAGRGR